MEITINVPDDLGKQIRQMQDIDTFISEIVKEAMMRCLRRGVSDAGLSKWQKIARRVHDDPVHLAGYSKQLKKDISEFRENFESADGDYEKISS